jgi:hypothetical protein
VHNNITPHSFQRKSKSDLPRNFYPTALQGRNSGQKNVFGKRPKIKEGGGETQEEFSFSQPFEELELRIKN